MELRFYKTDDADNVVNKTLTDELVLNVRVPSSIEVRQFEVILSRSQVDYRDYSIVYIPDVERYYFIRSVGKGPVIRVALECDYLMTYQDGILASSGVFVRDTQEGDYGEMTVNDTGEREITHIKSLVNLESDDGVLLSVVGWGGFAQ